MVNLKLNYTLLGMVTALMLAQGFSGHGYLHQVLLVIGGLLIGIVFEKIVVDFAKQEG